MKIERENCSWPQLQRPDSAYAGPMDAHRDSFTLEEKSTRGKEVGENT